MSRLIQKLCVFFVAIGLTLQARAAQNFSAIVAFGDSLSDLGNTYNDLGNYLSYFVNDKRRAAASPV